MKKLTKEELEQIASEIYEQNKQNYIQNSNEDGDSAEDSIALTITDIALNAIVNYMDEYQKRTED